MNILALDTGLSTGWAFGNGDMVESGARDFHKRRGESNGIVFLRFRKWLCWFFDGSQRDFTPTLLVYEQPHHRGGAATEIGVGMTTRVQEVAAQYSVECASCHTATLKKFATGNGRASKADMMAAARNLLDLTAHTTDPHGVSWVVGSSFAGEGYGAPRHMLGAGKVGDFGVAARVSSPRGDDEADAVCLLAWAQEEFDA